MEDEICIWCLNTVKTHDTTCCSCGQPIAREKYVGLDFFLEVCELAEKVYCYEKSI